MVDRPGRLKYHYNKARLNKNVVIGQQKLVVRFVMFHARFVV